MRGPVGPPHSRSHHGPRDPTHPGAVCKASESRASRLRRSLQGSTVSSRGNPTPAGFTNRFTVRAASAPPDWYPLLLIAVGADRDTIDRDQGSPTVATPPLRRGGLLTSRQPSRQCTSSTPIDGSFHQYSHQIRNGQRCNGDRQDTGEEADHSGQVSSSHHERDREDESTASDGEESMSFG